ncbi:MAG: glycosyltransferase family 1 protein [Verrucomicrobiales bacterium]|nr:glycosyltransferase family 1 protein [Verrucomicrobiales bacterium]MCP5556407.1 glycosyltransferase family 1 protein [Verrucomicrobiaceae bacterium]
MRILIVTDTFVPDINGVARTLCTLCSGLVARGHQVHVVTTLPAAAGEGEEGDCTRRVMGSVPLPGYPGLRIGMATTAVMLGVLADFEPDVAYVATETPLGIATIRAAARQGLPVVSGFHTNFHSYLQDYHLPGLESVAQLFLRAVHNQTVRTLTPSEDTALQLRSWGVNNVGVLGRGVNTELFHPGRRCAELRKSWGVGPNDPVFLYVGRIAAEKNLPLAVRAFEQVMQMHPGAQCVFVGDGPKLRWLEAEFPGFIYAGAKTGVDLAVHYASADVFVFPSLSETFGNVVLEAIASGLSTVAFDYAAPRLLIQHGVNGRLADFGDETALLQQVAEAATHWNDAALRAKAVATAADHSWGRVMDSFESELVGAVHGRPARRSEDHLDSSQTTPTKL